MSEGRARCPSRQEDRGDREPRLWLCDRLALRPAEVATVLGLSERTVRSILPQLPHLRVGTAVLVPVEPLREWLRARAETRRSRSDAMAEEILSKLHDSR